MFLLPVAALIFSLFFPLHALLYGVLFLGVPHVLSDVRYLVCRPRLFKRPILMWPLCILLLPAILRYGFGWALIAALVPFFLGSGPLVKRIIGVALYSPLIFLAFKYNTLFLLAFVFLHNIIGVIIWLVWNNRPAAQTLPFLMILVVGSFFIFFGPLDVFISPFALRQLFGMNILELGSSLAPFASLDALPRWVVFAAFLQTLHYIVWLVLIPKASEPLATLTQKRTSLVQDCGWLLIILVIAAGAALAIYGAIKPWDARILYLLAASFHGYIEIFFLNLVLMEGRKNVFGMA